MVAAVGEHRPYADYGITCEHAVGQALDYALFDGGYVLFGNGAADNLFGELEVLLARFEAYLAVSLLSVSARLLFILALRERRAENGLFVVYLRGAQVGVGAELCLQFLVYYVEVNFALTSD